MTLGSARERGGQNRASATSHASTSASAVGRSRRGFTLVELLVVVAVISILAAIAIPQYVKYRQRSFDASSVTDLRSASAAEEAVFTTSGAYVNCRNANCQLRLPGFHSSPNGNIRMRSAGPFFTGTATNLRGSGKVWSYNSADGGLQ